MRSFIMDKQYKHILIPLDGSELAELALTDAVAIAHLSHAEITLLHVVPPLESGLTMDPTHPIYVDQQWSSQKLSALEYLNSVCKRLGNGFYKIHKAIEIGPAAETIIDYAHQHPIDLIVMSTHGRSGLKRWVYGSVADKVLRAAGVPVLLIRADVPQVA
jgi:nucleotide-binding universal stress UspA family protein